MTPTDKRYRNAALFVEWRENQGRSSVTKRSASEIAESFGLSTRQAYEIKQDVGNALAREEITEAELKGLADTYRVSVGKGVTRE